MDITTATPAQIDTKIADLLVRSATAHASIERAMKVRDRIDAAEGYEKGLPWNSPATRAEAQKTINAEMLVAEGLTLEMTPLHAEYSRRGGWSRFYLVTNTGGHVHRNMACSTCFPTTEYAWLTEQSGMTDETLVEMAGEKACTVCFPDAPVDVLRRKTRLEAPEAKAKREEREAKKAAADAEKVVVEGVCEYSHPQTKTFKTLRAASQFASSQRADILDWGISHPSAAQWQANAERVEQAIAAKTGRPVIEVEADSQKRALATYKRRQQG